MSKFHGVLIAAVFIAIGIYVGARYNVPFIGKSAS